MNQVFVDSVNRERLLEWYNEYHQSNLTFPELITTKAGKNIRFSREDHGWHITFKDDIEAVHFKLSFKPVENFTWD